MARERRSHRRVVNESLPPVPTHDEIASAMRDLTDRDRAGEAIYGSTRWFGAFSASVIAAECGVRGARRLGRGAVKGSWSGTMSASLRIAPTLRAMERRGLVYRVSDVDSYSYRYLYGLTKAGTALAEGMR